MLFPFFYISVFTFKCVDYSILEIKNHSFNFQEKIKDGLVPEDQFIGYIKQSTYNFIVSVCGKSI